MSTAAPATPEPAVVAPPPRPRTGPRALRAALVAAFVLLTALRPTGFAPLERADDWTYDHALLPLLPAAPTRDDLVIVHIDDRTLDDLGERWPLSRATWARFLRRARDWRPALIVLDVVFDQPNDTSAVPFGEAVIDRAEALGLAATAPGKALTAFIDEELVRVDADRQLSTALAEAGNVVLGALFTRSATPAVVPDAPRRVAPIHADPRALALTATDVVTSHPRLIVSALASGAMNVIVDSDGSVRRYPYAVAVADDAYASLALAAVTVTATDPARADALVARAVAHDGAAPRLRFRPADRPFPQLAFSDLLLNADEGAPAGDLLAGKILFVGASALGVEDQVRTPVGYRTPGVEVHATAAENLMLGTFLVSSGAAQAAAIAETLLVLGLFALLLGRGARGAVLFAGGAGALALHAGAVVGAASGAGWLLDLVSAPLGVVALGAGELGLRWRAVKRERQDQAERERQLAAERDALERFREVVDNVADAIVTVDAAGQVAWMNPAAEALFLRRLTSTAGLPVATLVPGWVHGLPAAELRDGRQTSPGSALRGATPREAEAALPTGATVPVEVTVTPMRAGDRVLRICVFRNVAARKAVERMKDEFVSTVNHELRTPVTSILGSLKLVQGGIGGEVAPAARQLVDIALQNGERLLALVNELLDLAKLEAGAVEDDLAPLALGAVVAEAVEANRGYGARFGVTLALSVAAGSEEAQVRGNARRLVQVVTNLVSNAVKHSPTGGEVAVAVSEGAAGRVRVAVADRGPGIAAEFQAHIFEKFATTVAGDGKKRPGTGLGLAIARRIVADHGGRIGLESAVGEGTTFWFELPKLL